MGLFNKHSNDQARVASANGDMHHPPVGVNTSTGYGSQPINGAGHNKGPLGDRGMMTGNHGSVSTATHTGPAPLVGSTSPGTSPRSSAESKGAEREAVRLARKGKTKDRMGKLLGNSRMKQEGQQLRAQSEHLRMQQSELDEAARLEHEAGMRRQRAVGMGADPVLASGTTGFAPNNHNGARRV